MRAAWCCPQVAQTATAPPQCPLIPDPRVQDLQFWLVNIYNKSHLKYIHWPLKKQKHLQFINIGKKKQPTNWACPRLTRESKKISFKRFLQTF